MFDCVSVRGEAHAKNYSLLISKDGRYRPAPLYDIASWLPYSTTAGRDKLAMSIDGNSRFDEIMPRHWQETAKRCGFDQDLMLAIIRDLIARLPDNVSTQLADCREEGIATSELEALAGLLIANTSNHAQVYGSEVMADKQKRLPEL